MYISRTGNSLHNTWNTHEHLTSPSMQPMLFPRSTISLDKDHGNINLSYS